MKTAKTLFLPDVGELESLEQANEVIKELINVIQEQQQTLYGDMAQIEERLTALEP